MFRSACLLALLVASVSCSDYPYTHEEASICAVDGDSLIIVVTRETGRSKTRIGPCPKGEYKPKHLHTQAFVYSLKTEGDPQVQQGPSFDLSGQPVTDAMWRRIESDLNIPQARRLFDIGSDIQAYESSGISQEQTDHLRKLGFEPDDALGFIDQPEGRWYLGLDPLNQTIQLACLEQEILATRNWPAYSGIIWNHAQNRLILLNDWESAPSSDIPYRFPRDVTIWNYKADTTRTVTLRPPRIDSAAR